jgi:hydrogenase expression/formation protein HypE
MKTDIITLDHGSGGKKSNSLISEVILPIFDNPILSQLNDSATINIQNKKLAFSTDSYVVEPIFFAGGNIGDLAINGTVNDIAMSGATPLYISVGLIIEEGFPLKDLKKILLSMKNAASKASVIVVTGDTKVVPKGAVDKIFINTSGIGLIPDNINISSNNAQIGDKIILSGTIGDHGATIFIQREDMQFDTKITSDTQPLNHLVKDLISVSDNINVLRDPTRGGIGTSLNEIANQSEVSIKIYESQIPIKKEVSGICELLGFDPIYLANEGKLLAFVDKNNAESFLLAAKKNSAGQNASIIGEVYSSDNPGKVFMKTRIGGSRIIDMMLGEQIPRIC